MRRHSIIVRLGSEDYTTADHLDEGSVVTELCLSDDSGRLLFGLNQIVDELSDRSLHPSETAVDLLLLAGAVTAADTRINRESESQDSWSREIDLHVPVADYDLWQGLKELLERTLHFLTGDFWRIFFISRSGDQELLSTKPDNLELEEPSFDSVCLFSGGLDSFTGAIDLLESEAEPIFVSHYWDASTSSQLPCASALANKYGNMLPRLVRAHVGFPNEMIENSRPENTLRARSFLFFSLAALTASCLDKSCTIYVPENGLISLNVPLDPLRLGAWSTRTTHPFYMARWGEVLQRLDICSKIENPYRFMTKGEMLRDCGNQELLQSNLDITVSCSAYTKGRYQGLSHAHCGYCVPCLIRRASIEGAFGTDPTEYTFVPGLDHVTLDSMKAEGENVRSFQMLASRLSAKPQLSRILVHKPGPLSDYPESDIQQYSEVFLRGILEVDKLVRKVRVKPK